jgi:hypothetical protein
MICDNISSTTSLNCRLRAYLVGCVVFLRRVLLANSVQARQGPLLPSTASRETHGQFRSLPNVENLHFSRSSANHPPFNEVCLTRRRVPFREPGGAIATVRKDEHDTASLLRQELKNPCVCTLRALSMLWHLEANHKPLPQIPQSPIPPLRISLYNRQNGQDFRPQRLPQCHQQRREGWQAPGHDPPFFQGHCQVLDRHAASR